MVVTSFVLLKCISPFLSRLSVGCKEKGYSNLASLLPFTSGHPHKLPNAIRIVNNIYSYNHDAVSPHHPQERWNGQARTLLVVSRASLTAEKAALRGTCQREFPTSTTKLGHVRYIALLHAHT
jgi:hypothetical protein